MLILNSTIISGLGFPPNPYAQNANEGTNNMIKRNLKKLNRISDAVKEIRERMEEQDVQTELSLIGQGERKVASGYEEFKIAEDKFYQMTAEQRLRFKERFNTAEMRRPILNSASYENHATVSEISINPEDSGIVYPPLPILHQNFNKAEKYLYSSPGSIKYSPVVGNTTCSLNVASASNLDSLHVVKFNSSGKYECDVN